MPASPISLLSLALAIAAAPAASGQPAASAPSPETVPILARPYIYSARRAYVAPELPDAPAAWVAKSYRWVDIILDAFPPGVGDIPVRHAALQRLDDLFHLQDAAHRPQTIAFLQERIEKALRGMETAPAGGPARVWKMYNDGFVVREGGITFGFDLIPGVPGIPQNQICRMTRSQLRRLVAQVDVLFVSHKHLDHANQEMAAAFLAAGKPVLWPPELWKDTPLAAKVLYAPRSTTKSFEVPIAGKPGMKLEVLAYPGHQGPVLNNVYRVTTPSGFTVMHMGDQSISGTMGRDYDWLDEIGNRHKVQILFTDCWYPDVKRLIRSVNPDVVITGHEDELAHPIDHREDYAQTYERLWGSPYPFVLMTWGESWVFDRAEPFLFNK